MIQSPADLFLLHYNSFSVKKLQQKEHWNWVSLAPQLMLSKETHAIYSLDASQRIDIWHHDQISFF